jgi:hypothetical protein
MGVHSAIDQDNVALVAHHSVGHGRQIIKASVSVETAILNDKRNIIDTVFRWKMERLTFFVLD